MITNSSEETKKFASDFAKKYKNSGGIILLKGDLGSGKTTFTQGFAEGLGIKDKIISPTFVLIRQHKVSKNKTLYHIDLYRLKEGTDSKEIGLNDMLSQKENIILIEWPERLKSLPKDPVTLEFKTSSPNVREIHVI
jgi:tRNA threonylcarbamoyladenosine biosynthesis protein TsaE